MSSFISFPGDLGAVVNVLLSGLFVCLSTAYTSLKFSVTTALSEFHCIRSKEDDMEEDEEGTSEHPCAHNKILSLAREDLFL